MLELRKGCTVPFPEKINEGYTVCENGIIANVGINKVDEVFQHFIFMRDEPMFFILELPAIDDDDIKVAEHTFASFHRDIYYIDDCTQEDAFIIMHRVGELLINDGLASFGYGCHGSGDEIMFKDFNVLTIYSKNISKYNGFLDEHNIPETDDLITARDTFTSEKAGTLKTFSLHDRTIYDIPKQFKSWGMYLAERREGYLSD